LAPPRPNACLKQALVGVDVAHPSQQRLVEQCSLDGQAPGVEKRGELARANGEWLGAGPMERCGLAQIAELQAPKRRGSTKRSSRPLARLSRACV